MPRSTCSVEPYNTSFSTVGLVSVSGCRLSTRYSPQTTPASGYIVARRPDACVIRKDVAIAIFQQKIQRPNQVSYDLYMRTASPCHFDDFPTYKFIASLCRAVESEVFDGSDRASRSSVSIGFANRRFKNGGTHGNSLLHCADDGTRSPAVFPRAGRTSNATKPET